MKQRLTYINRTYSLLGAALLLICSGCEKDITFNLDETPPKLVVEATVENDQPPVVILSSSLAYFSKLSLQQLAASFVRGADVFVSNGTRTAKLKEYAVPLGGGNSFYYYSIDSSNGATAFAGEFNRTYTLRIVSAGKEYNATTTIPNPTKIIDSVYYVAAPPQVTGNKVVIMARATDPPGFGDYVRYFTKRNREPYLAPENSAFDDLFVDGTSYELPVTPGFDRNKATITDDDRYFQRGDTVGLKLSNIDKTTFDFWRTLEYSYQSIGNPFSTPTKVLGNISGDALGYFGGYASQYRTLIIR